MNPMRRTLALSVCCSLAGVAASQGHANLRAGDAAFAPDVEPALEVMRAKTGHLLVRPALNGREAGWFIFDTGAAICVISTPLAEPFDLEPTGSVSASGVGGGEPAQTLRAELLELGPMTLHDVPMMRTDLSFLREHLGVEVAGVIGYALFARCIAEVDLQAPRIALHDPKNYELPAGEWMPLAFVDSIPAVAATFEGHEGRFHLDIGANAALTLNEPTVRRHDLLAGRTLTDTKLGGVGGFVAAKRGKIASVELAGARIADVDATFALEAKGLYASEGLDGSIGTGLLKEFLLTFDYGGERISFLRRVAAHTPVAEKTEK